MNLSRRQTVAFALAAIAVFAGVAAAAHISGSVETSGTVPLQSTDGMTVFVEGDTSQLLEENFPLSSQVEVITEEGNATFTASGSANATIQATEIEGPWTNITAVDADPNTITVNPADKDSFVVGKAVTSASVADSLSLDDGTVDFAYSASANGRVTVQSLPADTRVAAVDQDTGNVLDEDTTSGSGSVTFDTLDSGDHDIVIQTFDPAAPTLSNASPTGDQSTTPEQISIDVNDSDFPRSDSVDVTIDLDGSQIHSETVTSNTTVTTSIPSSGQTGGSHSWSVDANDDYGESTSESFSYNVPSEIEFRHESPNHELIDTDDAGDPITIEAVFYEDIEDDPQIINRTTTDGTIDLEGLPVSSEFSVAVQAPGYHNRTVRLDSIFSQSDVFLINRDEQTVENRFVVSDRTGNFPPEETQIRIQTAVNESLYNTTGGFQWMTVAGDDLGADEGFVTDLVEEKRYRIVVRNSDGDQRILGSYTPEQEGVINLNIGSVVVDPEDPDSVGLNASWINATGQQPEVRFAYNDSTQSTETIWLHMYEYNNESNELLSNTSFSGPFGTFTHSETVPPGENGTTWVVSATADRGEQSSVTFQRIVGPNAPVLGGLPNWLVSIVFVGIIWTTAGLFSQLNGDIGAVVVACLGAILYFIDLVPGYLGTGVVALSLIAAAMLFMKERRAGGL